MYKMLLIDNGTDLLKKLQQLVPGKEITRKWTDPIDDFEEFDLIILSGGSIEPLQKDIAAFSHIISLIQTTTKPLIGICLGHQLIALSFGGTLAEMPSRKQGFINASVVSDHPIFEQVKKFEVWEDHSYIVEDEGPELQVLALSDHGIEALHHPQKPIFGFQFHPENYKGTTFGDEIFKNTLTYFGFKLSSE